MEWRRVTPLLSTLGLLSRIDRAALAMYCEAWGRWVEAEEALRKYGVMVKSPNGFPMQSPYLAVANKSDGVDAGAPDRVRDVPREPDAISVQEPDDDDAEFEALLD